MKSLINTLFFAGIFTFLLLPSSLWASNGAKPISTNGIEGGRGGAGTAVGDTSHVIAINPAAIANIDSWFRLDTAWGLRFGRTKFANSNNPRRFSSDKGTFVPALSISFNLNSEKVLTPWAPKGTKLTPEGEEEKFACENCGNLVGATEASCPNCGAEFIDVPKSEKPSESEKKESTSGKFVCENCGKWVPGDATKCPHCRAEFATEFECTNCSKIIPSDVNQCPHCNVKFEEPSSVTPSEEVDRLGWFNPPQLPHVLPRWRAGLAIFGVLGGGGEATLSSEVFDAVESQSSFQVLAVAPTISYRINEYLAIGASIHLYQASIADNDGITGSDGSSNGLVTDFTQTPPQPLTGVNSGLTYGQLFEIAGTNDAVATAFADVDNASAFGFGGSVGLLFQPSRYFSIGLSYTFEGQINDLEGGTATVDSSKAIDSIQSEDGGSAITNVIGLLLEEILPNGLANGAVGNYDDVTVEGVTTPAVLNVGLAIRPMDRLMIAIDFRWIRWSSAFQEFRATLSGGDNADINTIVGSNQLISVTQFNWEDQYVIALGLELVAFRSKNGTELILRVGYNHGNSPAPKETLGPTTVIPESHITAGLEVRMDGFGFSAGFVHAFTETNEIRNNVNLPEFSNTESEGNQDAFFFGLWREF